MVAAEGSERVGESEAAEDELVGASTLIVPCRWKGEVCAEENDRGGCGRGSVESGEERRREGGQEVHGQVNESF